jgi:hypothetical protein
MLDDIDPFAVDFGTLAAPAGGQTSFHLFVSFADLDVDDTEETFDIVVNGNYTGLDSPDDPTSRGSNVDYGGSFSVTIPFASFSGFAGGGFILTLDATGRTSANGVDVGNVQGSATATLRDAQAAASVVPLSASVLFLAGGLGGLGLLARCRRGA